MDRAADTVGRVLYVDPDADAAGTVADALGEAGVETDHATGTDAALDRLLDVAVDCVVSAHDLPGGDGLALLERVRERYPTVSFVLFPAQGDEELASAAVSAGVSEYVPREGPTGGIDRLVERVNDVLEGRPGSSAVTAGTASVPTGVSEALKERAMDESPVGITIADATREDEPLIYVNEAFERLTGYAEETALGQNCRFLQGEATDEEPVARLRAAVDAEEPESVELVNYRKDGERFWNRVDIAPIYDEAGELTHFVGFQSDITARKRAEFAAQRRASALEAERESLERLLGRLNGLIQDVTATLVRAASREGIEQEVCERVSAADPYSLAWIGDRDLATDRISPVACAVDGEPVDPLDPGFEDDGPVARAFGERSVQVVHDSDDRAGGLHGGEWPDQFRSMAAIPLVYRDALYGVLAVYATEPAVFDQRERAVLTALGRATATAINALENQQHAASDAVVELEFDLSGTDLCFDGLADRLGCRLEHVGSVRGTDRSSLFFDIDGAEPDRVREVLADLRPRAEATLLTETEDGCLFEFSFPEASIVEVLAERGIETRSITASSEGARLTVGVPRPSEDRSVVELLEERYPAVELLAYRERERPARTKREFLSGVEERLTERQRNALQRADAGGYFEWPRAVTGEDLAESMGVSRSTFHQHLRAAQRKLVEEFHDGRLGPR